MNPRSELRCAEPLTRRGKGKLCGRSAGHAGKHLSEQAHANKLAATRDWLSSNRGQVSEYQGNHRRTVRGKASKLLGNARYRAKRRGIPCDLTLEWVEAELESVLANGCPYLGIPVGLDCKLGDPHAPTIDQFNPGTGYTQDNCIIVSHKANTMKNDAPPEFVERLARNVTHLRRTRFHDINDRHIVTEERG